MSLYMARVLFLQHMQYEFVGTMYIAAALKQNNHQCNVLIGVDKDILNSINKIKPDIIAFSCMSTQYAWITSISEKIKSKYPSIPIVAGGPHPTLCPDETIQNPYIDMICRGEGEYTMTELADCIDNGKETKEIKGLWVKKNGEVFKNNLRLQIDINNLAWADREIYSGYPFFRREKKAYFVVNRGCIHNCDYCSVFLLNKKVYESPGIPARQVRLRSVDNIISEITSAFIFYRYKRHYRDYVHFYDSTLTINKEWLISFLSEYKKKVNIPFGCNINADLIDEEIISLLKQANCSGVTFGIETGNENLRKSLLNKRVTNSQIEKAAGLLRKYKILFFVNSMYCLPGETLSDAFDTIRLLQRIKPTESTSFIYLPLPGTKLGERAFREGYILRNMAKNRFRSCLRQRDNQKIDNLCKLAHIAIKKPLLLPLIKFLIRFPPNYLFDNIYMYYTFGSKIDVIKPNSFLHTIAVVTKIVLGSYKRRYCRKFGYYTMR